jgi:hypothetical protein
MVDEGNTANDDDMDATEEQSQPLSLSADEKRTLFTQPFDLSVLNLVSDVGRGRIILAVKYQRQYVWDDSRASRLIESLLLNVPIPVCYFAEDDDGNYEVIDGLQRITSMKRFVEGDFALRGLSVLTEVEGKHYKELNPKDQRRLDNRTLRCIVITADSHPDIKFDVFERLNTGAAKLTAQELRNSIYRGPFNDALRRISNDSQALRSLLQRPVNPRMEDEELVLRFFALAARLDEYREPLRQFLNGYMRDNIKNTPEPELIEALEDCASTAVEVFGSEALQTPRERGARARGLNRALFDSVMIGLYLADRAQVRSKAPQVKALRERLVRDATFKSYIARATADRGRMYGRISAFADGLQDLGISVRPIQGLER